MPEAPAGAVPLSFLSAGLVIGAAPRCKAPADWLGPLRMACLRFGLTTRLRLAAFLAQVGHESGDLNRLSESLDYSAAALLATWPTRITPALAQRIGRTLAHPANQPAIAEAVYGGRMGNAMLGDAWRYRGAGLIQITGFAGHDAVAQAFGMPTEDVPAWLRTMSGAALSAAWWWSKHGLNDLADREDTDGISRRINGGDNGLADRRDRYRRARGLLLA